MTRWPQLRDGVFAASLLVFGVVISTSGPLENGTVVDTLLLPLVIAPLFIRRRAPLAAAAAFAAGVVLSALPTFATYRCGLAVPIALVILFTLAARATRARALVGLALVCGAMIVLGYTELIFDDGIGFATFALPLCAGAWAGGRMVHARERLSRSLAERSAALVRQREQTAQLAVEIERTRLACELDTAARERVRIIVGLAEQGSPAVFARIEREGREALNEMRGLLDVLRSDEHAARAPRPTLAQLDALLEQARAGGRVVALDVSGERRPLPSGVELTAYRAIQHALVAVADPVTVQLRYLAADLELEIHGHSADGTSADVAVLAARERITAYGGGFRAERTHAGARVVWARLPLGAAVG